MKNNSFRYLHLFLVICSAGLIFTTFSSKEESAISRQPTSIPKVRSLQKARPYQNYRKEDQDKPVPHINRGPASVRPYQRIVLKSSVKFRSDIKLSAGHVLAENLGAIPLADWKPGMPPLIHNDGVYGFFEKKSGDVTSIPVAYNKAMNRLHPVSAIIHVRGVDEATRQTLLQAGHTEYYYFKSIQRLSLRSTPGQVVKLYESLRGQGLNAKLEVVREGPRSR